MLRRRGSAKKKVHAHPALLSVQPSLPTFEELVLSWDLSSFHSLGPLLALRPPCIGVAYLTLTTQYQIRLQGAPPRQDRDLVDSPEHVYLQLWWMNQSCCEIQMCFRLRIPGVIKQCLLFVPLIGHLNIQSCSGIFFNVCLPFPCIWVHRVQELCLN